MQFNWSPKIGDPTVGGWLTVILYLLASVSCWRAACKVGTRDIQERRGWQFISVLFLALGVNKQLDLQSALTEAGRVVANVQGWYAQRALIPTRLYRRGRDYLYDRRGSFGDVGAASAASGALGSNRYSTRSLLCVDPSGAPSTTWTVLLAPNFFLGFAGIGSQRWAVLLWSC